MQCDAVCCDIVLPRVQLQVCACECVMQCDAVCCSVLQCVACVVLFCSVVHYVAVHCSELQRVTVECGALQCVLQCIAVRYSALWLQCVEYPAVHCSALQCIAVRYSAVWCVPVCPAVGRSMLTRSNCSNSIATVSKNAKFCTFSSISTQQIKFWHLLSVILCGHDWYANVCVCIVDWIEVN